MYPHPWSRSPAAARPRGGSRFVAVPQELAHLEPLTWWDDMNRQNELIIAGEPTLRFPSIMIRLVPDSVVDCLRRIRQAHGP